MASRPLRGKVAAIINEREVAINIGAEVDVRKGMKFKILADAVGEITDPETGEVLGHFEREKVRVEAFEVHPKFTICRTYRMNTIKATGLFATNLFSTKDITETLGRPGGAYVETLRADETELPEPLSEDESYVKKGDNVVEIEDNV